MPDFGKYVSRLPASTPPELARALADVFRDLLIDIPAYEEGKFTPVIKLGTTTQSASVSEGRYIRIGKLVWFHITAMTITKSGTGFLTVEGLPFIVVNSTDGADAVCRWSGITSNPLIMYIAPGTTKLAAQKYSTSGYVSDVSDADCSATYNLWGITGCYEMA